MTVETPKPKNDSSDQTVIGFEGSEQHHNLKNQPGEKGDPDHAHGDESSDQQIKKTVKESEEDNAVSAALKEAVEK